MDNVLPGAAETTEVPDEVPCAMREIRKIFHKVLSELWSGC